MEQVIFAGYVYGADPPTTDTRYNVLQGGYTWAVDEYTRWQVISTDGVIKNLGFRLEKPPGAGKKYTFTLYLNGNPTALTFDIADAAKIGSDMVNEVAVTGGDTVTIECVPDGTPTSTGATYSSVFVGDNPNESLILGKPSSNLDRAHIDFGQVMTSGTSLSDFGGAENDRRQVIPTSGKIKNFYVVLNIDPGTPPDAYRRTVRLNGATVAQSPIVTITANDKTGSDLVHELAVVAGDYITLMVEPVNTPSMWPYAGWGLTFEADIDGESIVIAGSYNNLPTTWTRYIYLSQFEGSGWDVNENRVYQLGQVCTLKKLNVLITAAPGVGVRWDFNLSIGEIPSNVTATIADPNTTGDSGALEDTVSLFEHVSLSTEQFGGVSNAADAYWGFVCYIEPPVPSGSEDLLGKFDVGQDSGELLAKADVQQSGSAELLGKADVQQSDSAELLGRAEVQQSGSAELLGRAEIQDSGSAELLGNTIVRHVGTPVELLGNATIRQPGSTDLLGRFEAQATVELLGKAVIRQPGSAELISKGIIRNVGSVDLLGKAVIRHVGTPAELLGEFVTRHEASVDLLGELVASHSASLDLLGELIVRQVTSEDLLCELIVRQEASVDLHAAFESQATVDLFVEFIVRQPATINLPGEFTVKHSAGLDLPAKLQITHSEHLFAKLWIRHPYRLWTNRRYVNGVVELDEIELDDALLEYVIEGVMNDIRSQLISEAMLVYDSWTDITKTPKLIRRATTYGTVASLYSRDINDPNRRIVMGLRPIRIRAAEVRSAQERAMDYWESRMEKMMSLYLTSGGRRLMIVDTEDEEAVFSMEDIPFYSEDPYKIKAR